MLLCAGDVKNARKCTIVKQINYFFLGGGSSATSLDPILLALVSTLSYTLFSTFRRLWSHGISQRTKSFSFVIVIKLYWTPRHCKTVRSAKIYRTLASQYVVDKFLLLFKTASDGVMSYRMNSMLNCIYKLTPIPWHALRRAMQITSWSVQTVGSAGPLQFPEN